MTSEYIPSDWQLTRERILRSKIELSGWINYWLDQGMQVDDVKQLIPATLDLTLTHCYTNERIQATRYMPYIHRVDDGHRPDE